MTETSNNKIMLQLPKLMLPDLVVVACIYHELPENMH